MLIFSVPYLLFASECFLRNKIDTYPIKILLHQQLESGCFAIAECTGCQALVPSLDQKPFFHLTAESGEPPFCYYRSLDISAPELQVICKKEPAKIKKN